VVLWRGLAEVADKYVKKGSQIYIEGKLRTRSYEDKDKNKKYITEIVADVMQLLGKRSDDAGNTTQPQDTHTPATTEDKVQTDEPDITNDLPF
jgi:single-strand DNA-binding protein